MIRLLGADRTNTSEMFSTSIPYMTLNTQAKKGRWVGLDQNMSKHKKVLKIHVSEEELISKIRNTIF